MDFKKSFGMRLRHARMASHLTQKQLAERIGVNHAAIAQYEAGSNTLPVERAAQLAHVLGVSLDYLCGLTADPHPYPPHPGCDPAEQGSTP